MNKKEYWDRGTRGVAYKEVHHKLREWKCTNNITERCHVHHRDDTEECRKYNEEHYELWGFNEDGTFEYGKYVVFMTCAEHARHHRTGKCLSNETRKRMRDAQLGELNHFYGKTHSEETLKKLREANIGRHHTDASKAKMSAHRKGALNAMYGKHHTDEAKRRMSEIKKVQMAETRKLYHTYIANGGSLKWNNFLSALKNKDSEVVHLIGNIYKENTSCQ